MWWVVALGLLTSPPEWDTKDMGRVTHRTPDQHPQHCGKAEGTNENKILNVCVFAGETQGLQRQVIGEAWLLLLKLGQEVAGEEAQKEQGVLRAAPREAIEAHTGLVNCCQWSKSTRLLVPGRCLNESCGCLD